MFPLWCVPMEMAGFGSGSSTITVFTVPTTIDVHFRSDMHNFHFVRLEKNSIHTFSPRRKSIENLATFVQEDMSSLALMLRWTHK